MAIIKGHGEQAPVNGIAHEFIGSQVTTTDTIWRDRVGGLAMVYANAWTNTASYVGVTATGASITNTGFLKSPAVGQKLLFVFSANFAGNQNRISFGDTSNGVGLTLKRNACITLTDTSNKITVASLVTSVTSTTHTLAMLVDVPNQTATVYLYDTSGVLVETAELESVTGTVTDPLDFSADQVFDMTIATAFQVASACIFYLDDTPSDLATGLSWMAENPTLGAYPAWREI